MNTSHQLFRKFAYSMPGIQAPMSISGQAPQPIMNPVQADAAERMAQERMAAESQSATAGTQNPDILEAQGQAAQAAEAAQAEIANAQALASQQLENAKVESQMAVLSERQRAEDQMAKLKKENEILQHENRLKEQELRAATMGSENSPDPSAEAQAALRDAKLELREEELAATERLSALKRQIDDALAARTKSAAEAAKGLYDTASFSPQLPGGGITNFMLDNVWKPWAYTPRRRSTRTPLHGTLHSHIQRLSGMNPLANAYTPPGNWLSMLGGYLNQTAALDGRNSLVGQIFSPTTPSPSF